MSEQEDSQVQQAAQQALDEIARLHQHAVTAVWEQYPAPVPKRSRSGDGAEQQALQAQQTQHGQPAGHQGHASHVQ